MKNLIHWTRTQQSIVLEKMEHLGGQAKILDLRKLLPGMSRIEVTRCLRKLTDTGRVLKMDRALYAVNPDYR